VRSNYRPLHKIVLEYMIEDIVRGTFGPGQKLNEIDLANYYNVSRGPIREAIRMLEGQGLVHVIPGKGATVTRLSPSELTELYEIRIELEGLATRLAASRITDRQLARMQTHLDRMTENLDSVDAWVRWNDKFHTTLYQASDRKHLCEMIDDLVVRTKPYARMYVSLPGRLTSTHPDHLRIFDAVRARDGELAEALMQDHVRRGFELIVAMAAQEKAKGL
jgi:DNA-binding GntR family transcriptional regulator